MNPEDKIQNQIDNTVDDTAKESQFSVSATSAHTHNGSDSLLIATVDLPAGSPIKLGLGGMLSVANNKATDLASYQIQTSIVAGSDQAGAASITTDNLQLNLLHQPNNISNQSFITAFRPPVYANFPGTTITTTMGGNTVTTSGYGFTIDSLANALINIFNASGTLIETQIIVSNTDTVITISGTWLASTIAGTLGILQPVFLGAADTPYQRLYTREGTTGGLRFGIGPTSGGQNGLLYMDSSGNLYWRDKVGTSSQLNGGATPIVHVYTSNTTWTKPGGLSYVVIEVVGGGGKGGTGDSANYGTGGGGAGYSKLTITASGLGATESITVGTGSNGSGGGTTTFGALINATGGTDGGTPGNEPGIGGIGGGGDINSKGQGGGAGSRLNGVGAGGSSVLGGGAGGIQNAGNGNVGGQFGGGGSGGPLNAAGSVGGNGANGVIIVTEYY